MLYPLLKSRSLYFIMVFLPVVLMAQVMGMEAQQLASIIPLSVSVVGVITGLLSTSMVRIPPIFTDYLIVLIGAKKLIKYILVVNALLCLVVASITEIILTMLMATMSLSIDLLSMVFGLLIAVLVSELTGILLMLGSTFGFSIMLITSLIQPLILRFIISIWHITTNALAISLALVYALPLLSINFLIILTPEKKLRIHLAKISKSSRTYM